MTFSGTLWLAFAHSASMSEAIAALHLKTVNARWTQFHELRFPGHDAVFAQTTASSFIYGNGTIDLVISVVPKAASWRQPQPSRKDGLLRP